MYLSIIGPKSTVTIIEEIIRKRFPKIILDIHICPNFEDSPRIADQIQKKGRADALLFSGPTNYEYAKKRIKPNIFWTYLPYNRTSLMEALLKAYTKYGIKGKKISVDRYPKELVKEVLRESGRKEIEIVKPDFSENDVKFEEKLLLFHKKSKADLCLTSMEHIEAPLNEEGISCVRILPSEESVCDCIYHLKVLELSKGSGFGEVSVISVSCPTWIESEEETNNIRHQNELREILYAVAAKMDSSVFEESFAKSFIPTTKTNMEKIFLKDPLYGKLMELALCCPFNLGIGTGKNILEAKARSLAALVQSEKEKSTVSYLLEEQKEPKKLPIPDTKKMKETEIYRFQTATHLGPLTLKKLKSALEKENPITSCKLAKYMGITERSANRILLALETAGCTSLYAKENKGKGRPKRIIKVNLPEGI